MFDEEGTRYLDCINNVATGKKINFALSKPVRAATLSLFLLLTARLFLIFAVPHMWTFIHKYRAT